MTEFGKKNIDRRNFIRLATGSVLAAGAVGVIPSAALSATSPQDKPYLYRGASQGGSGFNPLSEQGIPLEQQARTWRELTEFQYDKQEVHPYTRCRIIVMNGIEVAAALFKHQMARMVSDYDLRQRIAVSRRIEQQQQKKVNGLVPANEHTLEVTVGYEQVAVDLTAWLAQNEPDPYVRAALNFALLEDFDHLYRYSNILDMKSNGYMKPEQIVGRLTEIMPGRPTMVEHRHPKDSVRQYVDYSNAAPITIMNIMTIVASEQQTMNFYMNVNNRGEDATLRGLYNEIGMVEEQHVSHYESLMDPNVSWLKNAVLHELHEVYLYHSFYLDEVDPRVRQIWELHRDMEIGHLHDAMDMYQQYANADPAEFIPTSLPEPTRFSSNIEYVRAILEAQIRLTAKEKQYVDVGTLSESDRYFMWRDAVNGDWVPSVVSIDEHIDSQNQDYRFEVAPHPIEDYQDRNDPSADYPPQQTEQSES